MTNDNSSLFVAGVSFHTAPLDILEKLAVGKDALQSVVKELSGWVQTPNLVVLSTCNRTEIIGTSADVESTKQKILTYFNTVFEQAHLLPEYLYCHKGEAAISHLFSVICGMDSMMLGETEIVGQLQTAFGVAQCEGLATSYMVQLFDAAFRTSRRVRGETGIDRGTTSVAKAGVHMARRIVGDLSRRRVLVVGAGETGALACTYLTEEKATLFIANRTHEKALRLAASTGGTAVSFSDLEATVAGVDVVFLATGSPTPLITREMVGRVQKKRRGELLLVVDISLPHNAETGITEVGNVFLFNMNDLKEVVASALSKRASERKAALRIIDEEVNAFFAKQRTIEIGPLISKLRTTYETISQQELARYENKISDDNKELFRQFANSLVNKLLHAPTVGIRELAHDENSSGERAKWFSSLFGLEAAVDESKREK